MIKKQILTISFLATTFVGVAGEVDQVVNDTVRLNEVVVTGTMTEVNRKFLPMTVTSLDKQELQGRYTNSVLTVLSEQVPGMFVTGRGVIGYGVANGAAGGMSIRGIGGSPNTQVLVLIDGHPQYMGMMGHPLPDAYESAMAEKIEVVRGPASVLYGSNAMAGVVNIVTKKQQQDGVHTYGRAMYGSYNTFNAEAHNAFRRKGFSSFVSLNYNRTDGHRENSEFDQYGGYAKLGYEFSSHWNVFADVNVTHYNAANPGLVSAPMIDNDAEITRGMTSFALSNSYARTSGALKFFYNWGNHQINDGYTAGSNPQKELYHSTDNMLGLSLYQSYSFFTGNDIAVGIDYARYGGHAWNTPLAEGGKNSDILSSTYINDVAGYINFRQILAERLTLNAGLRLDYNDKSGKELIPQVGISYIVTPVTVLKAIVSKGFRNPTIREMYMFKPQNPNLKPESLMNYEVSVGQTFWDNALHFDLNLFYINGKDIIFTDTSTGSPVNRNINKVENYGIELATACQLNSHLGLNMNYSYLHMKYPVPAAPEHQLYLGGRYARSNWSVATGLQYINGLYTAMGSTTTENYLLWNVRVAYSPIKIVEIFVKGENLLGQNYEINSGFPMPGATVFGGISINI